MNLIQNINLAAVVLLAVHIKRDKSFSTLRNSSIFRVNSALRSSLAMYLYRDPMRDGGKIRTPSVNSNPEYQLASRVATSQLKEPRVMPVDTRDSS